MSIISPAYPTVHVATYVCQHQFMYAVGASCTSTFLCLILLVDGIRTSLHACTVSTAGVPSHRHRPSCLSTFFNSLSLPRSFPLPLLLPSPLSHLTAALFIQRGLPPCHLPPGLPKGGVLCHFGGREQRCPRYCSQVCRSVYMWAEQTGQ